MYCKALMFGIIYWAIVSMSKYNIFLYKMITYNWQKMI